jgi:hypothetical protein
MTRKHLDAVDAGQRMIHSQTHAEEDARNELLTVTPSRPAYRMIARG